MASRAHAIAELLEPLRSALGLEANTRLAEFRVDDRTQRRLDELAHRANEGLLSPDKRTE